MSEKPRHESLIRLIRAANVDGPSALASALNESEQTVTNWGRRGVSKQGAIKAQSLFGCDVDWILKGKDNVLLITAKTTAEMQQQRKTGKTVVANHQQDVGNVDAARAFTGEVPVISWVQAGAWQDIADTFQPEDAERHLPIFKGHSSKTYALKVRGDSMTAPYGKSYPAGCYVIVDPEKRSPMNGDRIIALTPGSKEATFKVYKDEDGRRWLAPLNSTHPTIQEPFEVLGTVIMKLEDE
jgi:SOS-response transcriptional repressor LexA